MSAIPRVEVCVAEFPRDKEVVIELFTAYANSLPIDLTFQNFEHELSSLPGKYSPENGGIIYLAYTVSGSLSCSKPVTPSSNSTPKTSSNTSKVIGCSALRPFSPPSICELKRLYITPDSRGLGVGRLLLETVIEKAKELGYKEMMLDTLPSMFAARKMYEKYGFVRVEKYYETPIDGTVFMKLALQGCDAQLLPFD